MTEPDDVDMQAAEYVLGTLDADERAEAAARVAADEAFARAIRAWEERLGPLVGVVPEVAPPEGAYEAIAARLFGPGAASSSAPDAGALRRRVRRWQAATAGCALLAASLVAWIAVRDGAPSPGRGPFTAVLQRDAGAPVMIVDVDVAAHRLTVHPLAAAAPDGRAYELWIVDPALGAPRSLGLVPADGRTRGSLQPFDDAVITEATYAVTVEPAGGSPTGRPTTAPILAGKLSRSPP